MQIINRHGVKEDVKFDKITDRIKSLSINLENIDPVIIAQKVCGRICDGIKTSDLDELSAQICANEITIHPDFNTLATRIIIDNHHKNTSSNILEVYEILYNNKNILGEHSPLIRADILAIIKNNYDKIMKIVDYDRDFLIDYFGFKTLCRGYLLKVNNKIIERPQHMWLRVALELHGNNLEQLKQTYDLLSLKYFTHATPTLFHSCSVYPQMSSCFLLGSDDSIVGIYKTLSDVAIISKWAGGIGVHITNIRAKNSYIRKTGGKSDGILPMLRVYNATARYVNQSGKRQGSFAIYIEPWHNDIFEFLSAKKNQGCDEERARDLFYAMWIPDLFMKRVETNEKWSLMCPNECRNLTEKYGLEFEELYCKYENEGKYRKQIDARELWKLIIESQIETGLPYMLYKDHCNKKSNQKNLGCIKSSNLCAEIIEYSNNKEYAVCNLASISLTKFADDTTKTFNFEKLEEITKIITENLNIVIDKNFYPLEELKISNFKHRPIGIGVQGLADVFAILNYPYDGKKAAELNRKIFETIYFAALTKSCELAQKYGAYSSFKGSPISKGQFQFDLWDIKPIKNRYDWETLRTNIIKHGIRNSLLVALMPTASTSQILGNNECFEPFTSNLYLRRTNAGEFTIVNKYLVKELIKLNLWTQNMIEKIMYYEGSIQKISEIPIYLKQIFKTSREIKQKVLIDMSIGRGPYICQSQSLNLFFEQPTYQKLSSAHFYGWKNGLKTGSYYIRSSSASKSQKFTIDPKKENEYQQSENEDCLMCGS